MAQAPATAAIPRVCNVHLFASHSAKVGMTLQHPYSPALGRPRVVIHKQRVYLQDLSNEDSPNYYETDAHWAW